jgi:hypothetical protein
MFRIVLNKRDVSGWDPRIHAQFVCTFFNTREHILYAVITRKLLTYCMLCTIHHKKSQAIFGTFQLSFFQQTETGSQIREREDEVLILGIPAMLRDYHHTIRCLEKHNGVLRELFFSFIYREFSMIQYKCVWVFLNMKRITC